MELDIELEPEPPTAQEQQRYESVRSRVGITAKSTKAMRKERLENHGTLVLVARRYARLKGIAVAVTKQEEV